MREADDATSHVRQFTKLTLSHAFIACTAHQSQAKQNQDKKPAQEVLDLTVADVQRFIGKAEQHDDMTLIVVQIL